MTTLDDVFDTTLLAQMLDTGYVRAQSHPRLPLEILNYTNAAQYEGVWNEVTLACRGLIWNVDTGLVVARPFSKFFNLEEWGEKPVPDGPIDVYEKMDGSLGILYREPGGLPAIATRGSFTSPQALFATAWFRQHAMDYAWPQPGSTDLFEILYPSNRIVVDYGDFEGLVYLGTIDIEAGRSWSRSTSPWPTIPTVKRYPISRLADAVSTRDRPNAEGYVIHFPHSDTRIKVKGDEYKRLHRLLTDCSSVSVWETLRAGGDVSELLDRVPDEFYDWVKRTVEDLHFDFSILNQHIFDEYLALTRIMVARPYADERAYRKRFADLARDSLHTSALFALLDGKNITDYIWKQIKPVYTKPFESVDVSDAA